MEGAGRETRGHGLGMKNCCRLAVTRWYTLRWIRPRRSCFCAVPLQRWRPAWQPAELRWGGGRGVAAGGERDEYKRQCVAAAGQTEKQETLGCDVYFSSFGKRL